MNGIFRALMHSPEILLRAAPWIALCATLLAPSHQVQAQQPTHSMVLHQMLGEGLARNAAFEFLADLTRRAPHRLSGSPGADSAVAAVREMLFRAGADSVWSEPCMVPRWVRGKVERARMIPHRGRRASVPLSICALGGSVATPKEGIRAGVVEVRSFEELAKAAPRVRGMIVFFNRPMNTRTVNTFDGYGGAVDQRSRGASEAARHGAIGVLVRSVTLAQDDVPHTGTLSYVDSIPKIPAAAVSTRGADLLSGLLQRDPETEVALTLDCRTFPEVPSANVVGEIRGREFPGEIVLIGGHLDAWDKGQGAHDDGAGCAHAIEVIRLFHTLGIAPRRTIRAVLFMNEENGSRGGIAYGANPGRTRERHIAAIESDRGGFAPRGFTVQADSVSMSRLLRWKPLFEEIGAGRIIPGYGGVDITPIVNAGAVGIGLDVHDERYFDFHHSANDILPAVHPRELEMGGVATAFLAYLLSEEGF